MRQLHFYLSFLSLLILQVSAREIVRDVSATGSGRGIQSTIPSSASTSHAASSASSTVTLVAHSTSVDSATGSHASATSSSSSAVTPTHPAVQALFPIGYTPPKYWSYSQDVPGHFGPNFDLDHMNELQTLSAYYPSPAPDGVIALPVQFAQGMYDGVQARPDTDRSENGLFATFLGADVANLTTAKEATFAYSLYFSPYIPDTIFNFTKGGILPGLFGGDSLSLALQCTDGTKSDTCFLTGAMWHVSGGDWANGDGGMYARLASSAEQDNINSGLCNIHPLSICPGEPEGATGGFSIGLGAFSFQSGKRVTIAQRVRLNDIGQANGELELYVNGVSMVAAHNLVIRKNPESRIRGILMEAYYGLPGGSDETYAPVEYMTGYLSEFSLAITEELA